MTLVTLSSRNSRGPTGDITISLSPAWSSIGQEYGKSQSKTW